MTTIDRSRLIDLMDGERRRFLDTHPRSADLFEQAKRSLLYGVPMNWMTRWPGAFPVWVAEAHGARFTDVDGIEYVDLCLGDTGAMAGHGPKVAVDAIAERSAKGLTFMLPTEDAIWVGDEMRRRFGLGFWQFCLTATDANRFVLRLARELTGRSKVVVHDWNYHGTVDETFATLEDGRVISSSGNVGPPVDPALTTRVVAFNDLAGLEEALADGDVACCLFEPALTNIGIVLPDEAYHRGVRDLCTRYGTLLVIDETHTICAGPGGYTQRFGLRPDLLTIGKTLGAGVPSAAYGMTREVADRVVAGTDWHRTDVGGIGGTLAGNALSFAAMRATLGEVLTDDAFTSMVELAVRFTDGVQGVIAAHELPWHIVRLGCRAEYLFRPNPARDGVEAAAGQDEELDAFIHLFLLNRGILLTPFHNMALMSPATTAEDVDRHTAVFGEAVEDLLRA
ncbi:MAG: aspartate aminotransferase family protein [Actinobacteria bacterium]|nr:aspartate aminotransferase family protein [Actinomycetota bacterium]